MVGDGARSDDPVCFVPRQIFWTTCTWPFPNGGGSPNVRRPKASEPSDAMPEIIFHHEYGYPTSVRHPSWIFLCGFHSLSLFFNFFVFYGRKSKKHDSTVFSLVGDVQSLGEGATVYQTDVEIKIKQTWTDREKRNVCAKYLVMRIRHLFGCQSVLSLRYEIFLFVGLCVCVCVCVCWKLVFARFPAQPPPSRLVPVVASFRRPVRSQSGWKRERERERVSNAGVYFFGPFCVAPCSSPPRPRRVRVCVCVWVRVCERVRVVSLCLRACSKAWWQKPGCPLTTRFLKRVAGGQVGGGWGGGAHPLRPAPLLTSVSFACCAPRALC